MLQALLLLALIAAGGVAGAELPSELEEEKSFVLHCARGNQDFCIYAMTTPDPHVPTVPSPAAAAAAVAGSAYSFLDAKMMGKPKNWDGDKKGWAHWQLTSVPRPQRCCG